MKLDHINIVTPDLDATIAFFDDILGLKEGPRPSFKFPGAWLYGDAHTPALIHLNQGEDTLGAKGNIDHVALKGEDFDGLLEKLTSRGYEYDSRVVPGTGVRQVFFMAPFGVKIEIDFDPVTPENTD